MVLVVLDCEVHENCMGYTNALEICWYCEDYCNYMPVDRNIPSPRQLRMREKRQEDHKKLMESKEHKRGLKARGRGIDAEGQVITILRKYHIEANRVFLSGALKTKDLCGDIDIPIKDKIKKGEVKYRKNGFKTLYSFLAQDKATSYLFVKGGANDNKWLVVMPIEEFVDLL